MKKALLLPLLLAFWFGICDWGIAFLVQESVLEKAAGAAKWAAINSYDAAKLKDVFLFDDATAGGDSVWFSRKTLNPETDLAVSRVAAGTKRERVTLTVSGYEWLRVAPFLHGTYLSTPIQVNLPVADLRDGI